MAGNQHPDFLRTITGTHGRPSTLDVITLCSEADSLLKRVQRERERHAQVDHCSAIMERAQAHIQAAARERDPTRKGEHERQSAELLELHQRALRDVPAEPNWFDEFLERVGGAIRIAVTHAVTVALNSILLGLLYGLLIYGLLFLINAFVL